MNMSPFGMALSRTIYDKCKHSAHPDFYKIIKCWDGDFDPFPDREVTEILKIFVDEVKRGTRTYSAFASWFWEQTSTRPSRFEWMTMVYLLLDTGQVSAVINGLFELIDWFEFFTFWVENSYGMIALFPDGTFEWAEKEDYHNLSEIGPVAECMALMTASDSRYSFWESYADEYDRFNAQFSDAVKHLIQEGGLKELDLFKEEICFWIEVRIFYLREWKKQPTWKDYWASITTPKTDRDPELSSTFKQLLRDRKDTRADLIELDEAIEHYFLSKKRPALENKRKELIKKHQESWFGPITKYELMSDIVDLDECLWDRGRLIYLRFNPEENPFRSLHLLSRRPGLFLFEGITFLDMTRGQAYDIIRCISYLKNCSLYSLGFVSCYLGNEGARAIAEATHLNTLSVLNLTNNFIGPSGAKSLANAEHLKTLHTLRLNDNPLGREGQQILLESPYLSEKVKSTIKMTG